MNLIEQVEKLPQTVFLKPHGSNASDQLMKILTEMGFGTVDTEPQHLKDYFNPKTKTHCVIEYPKDQLLYALESKNPPIGFDVLLPITEAGNGKTVSSIAIWDLKNGKFKDAPPSWKPPKNKEEGGMKEIQETIEYFYIKPKKSTPTEEFTNAVSGVCQGQEIVEKKICSGKKIGKNKKFWVVKKSLIKIFLNIPKLKRNEDYRIYIPLKGYTNVLVFYGEEI